MTTTTTTTTTSHELVLERIFDAPPEQVFRAWTDPTRLPKWFVPKPMTLPACEIDPRQGGVFRTVMRAPDGQEFDNTGVFLDVVPNRRLVFTDALIPGWKPSDRAFMVASVELEDLGGKTRYTARAMHWSAEDREAHEKMGFHEGWGQCADQLAALLASM